MASAFIGHGASEGAVIEDDIIDLEEVDSGIVDPDRTVTSWQRPVLKRGVKRDQRVKPNKAELVRRATERGITPVEVMLENMRWWHKEAEKARKRFTQILSMPMFGNDVSPEVLSELADMCRCMNKWRDKSQECAVDAAPYIHPKLGAIMLKGEADNPVFVQLKAEEARNDIANKIARLTDSSEEDDGFGAAVE